MASISRQQSLSDHKLHRMGAVLSQVGSGLILNLATWLLGLASLLLLDRTVGRRWRADRSDRLIAEALQMARVTGDENEPEMARALANSRLAALGFTEAWLAAQKAEARAAGNTIFDQPRTAPEETEISSLARAIRLLQTAFERAQEDARPHEDTLIRISLVSWVFALAFFILAVVASQRAMGW